MKDPLLIEIGLEELPPLLVNRLADDFCDSIKERLTSLGYETGKSQSFGTPRRIATLIEEVLAKQGSKKITRKGPGIDKAFDSQGKPTKAALGFAQSCGVTVEELKRL